LWLTTPENGVPACEGMNPMTLFIVLMMVVWAIIAIIALGMKGK
jgi:hypothetical protein